MDARKGSRDLTRAWRLMLVAAIVLSIGAGSLAACGGADTGAADDVSLLAADTIVGAGGSFSSPLLSKWGEEYQAEAAVKLDYRSMGPADDIAAVQAHTADFAVSDAPLEQSALAAAGIVQFPVAARGVVPVVNVAGRRGRRASAHRGGSCPHLRRGDHELGRCGHR